jgi:RNA-directed DNA polymerase
MSKLDELKVCTSLEDFAKFLGGKYTASSLAYILYHIPVSDRYTKFNIAKKSGGLREINVPNEKLKFLQKILADRLHDCKLEIDKKRIHPNPKKKFLPFNHGFTKSFSIATNARLHKRQRYVLNFDLEGFFPSINFGRVRGYFIKNNDFLLNEKTATIIAQIACHQNELPQGSPCSPIISNLISHILDVRLVQIAKKYRCQYSRYADDITFSTNQAEFPSIIAFESSVQHGNWMLSPNVEKAVKSSGFQINNTKTRMQYRNSRQMVTGLVVNKHINVPKEYYRSARSMCHSLFTKGEFTLPQTHKKGTLRQLEGTLSYIHHIKDLSVSENEKIEVSKKKNQDQINKRAKQSGATELYSRFLFYRYFVALDAPLIMCEGKTDIVYLKCAIKQLRKTLLPNFSLVEYFHNKSRAFKVMRIHEGADALKNFIEFFVKETDFPYKIPRKHPVIILLDNDDKASNAVSCIKGKYAKPAITYNSTTNLMYHVVENLYLVIMPTIDGKSSCIENFFDSKTLATKNQNQKTFSTDNNYDPNKFYGKNEFATTVIKPNQSKIDFSGFVQILTLIQQAIDDYKIRCAN